jgi:hypothetical protein
MDEWGSGRAVAMETYRSQSPLILAEDLSAPDVSNLASDCSQILDEKRDLTVRDFGFRAQIGSSVERRTPPPSWCMPFP